MLIKYFSFPRSGNLLKAWLQVLNKNIETWTWSRHKVVCSVHFSAKDLIKRGGRCALKINSIPKIAISSNISTKIVSENSMVSMPRDESQAYQQKKGCDNGEILRIGVINKVENMERCRFCYVEENKDLLKDIFNNGPAVDLSIAKIAEMLTGLSIKENDPYTKLSCLDCFNKLIDSYHCRKTILKTNQLLIKNEINNKCNNSDGNFEQDNHKQSILTDDIAENIKSECDDEDQIIHENNQYSNISIKNDQETTIDGNKSDCKNDEKSLDLIIKDEIDIEETCVKIENDFNDVDENNHHPNISIGESKNEPIINDNEDSDRYCSDGLSNREFSSIIEHLKHTDLEDQKKEISNRKCHICKKIFSSKYGMAAHLKRHANNVHFQCNICSKKLTTKGGLKQHLLSHNSEKSFQCNICKKDFIYKHNLIAHLKRHENPIFYECKFCHTKLKSKGSLKKHLFTHNRGETYQCDICKKNIFHKHNLAIHLKRHEEKALNECNICHRRFMMKKHLKVHLLARHAGEKPYQCNICKRKFSNSAYLSAHSIIHTDDKTNQCHICNKKFITKGYVKRHLLSHTNDRPYPCNICKKKFLTKSNLDLHLMIHKGEKSYQCHICGKKFFRKSYLSQHLVTHTGEKPYQCHICSQKFSFSGNLKGHLAKHTSEKPN